MLILQLVAAEGPLQCHGFVALLLLGIAHFLHQILVDLEAPHQLIHIGSLRRQLFTGCGTVGAGVGVLLHHNGDLLNPQIDLLDGLALLLNDFTDAGNALQHLLHHVGGLVHAGGGVLGDNRSALHSFDGALDERGGLLRRLGGFSGQRAHLIGHNRKAFARLSGAGRLHRGVEGEDIGLEGNVLNGLGNLADFLRAAGNLLHGVQHLAHLVVALLGLFPGHIGPFPGALGGRDILLGASGNAVDGGRQLFHRPRLLHSALGQLLGPLRQRAGTVRNIVGGGGDIGNDIAGLSQEAADAVLDALQLTGEIGAEHDIIVAVAHLLRQVGDIADDLVQHLLAGAQRIGHAANGVGGVVGNILAQVAMAHGHNGGLRLPQRLENIPNLLAGQQHHADGAHHNDDGGDKHTDGILPLLYMQGVIHKGLHGVCELTGDLRLVVQAGRTDPGQTLQRALMVAAECLLHDAGHIAHPLLYRGHILLSQPIVQRIQTLHIL